MTTMNTFSGQNRKFQSVIFSKVFGIFRFCKRVRVPDDVLCPLKKIGMLKSVWKGSKCDWQNRPFAVFAGAAVWDWGVDRCRGRTITKHPKWWEKNFQVHCLSRSFHQKGFNIHFEPISKCFNFFFIQILKRGLLQRLVDLFRKAPKNRATMKIAAASRLPKSPILLQDILVAHSASGT